MITVVPFLYALTIIGAKDLFNAGYVYITTKFWLTVVLFMTALTWTFCLFMLASAFKQKGPSRHKCPENSVKDGTSADPEKALVTASTVPARSGSVAQHFVTPVAMVYLEKSRGPHIV